MALKPWVNLTLWGSLFGFSLFALWGGVGGLSPSSFYIIQCTNPLALLFLEHPRCYSPSLKSFTWHFSLSLEDNCVFSQRPLDRRKWGPWMEKCSQVLGIHLQNVTLRHYDLNCCTERFLLVTSLYAPAFNLGAQQNQAPLLILPQRFLPEQPSFYVIMSVQSASRTRFLSGLAGQGSCFGFPLLRELAASRLPMLIFLISSEAVSPK